MRRLVGDGAGKGWKRRCSGKTNEKKRGVRKEAAFKRRKKDSRAVGQLRLRRARTQDQYRCAANTDEQGTEEHGNAAQQRKAGRGTEHLADGNGSNGSAGALDEGQ